MGATENISHNVWKIKADSNIYLIKDSEIILIDTGRRSNKKLVKECLDKVVDIDKISKVIFTHLHYDHIGNFDLFKNADFYASKEEIETFTKDRLGTILDNKMSNAFNPRLKPVDESGLQTIFDILETPGHTKGCICLYYRKEKILFSGDTLFFDAIGRTDLPTSVPTEMNSSLLRLQKIDYNILCPGHEY
jgi:hydroxyacylglutathione hydrolase